MLVRIVCRELEAWFLGDLFAVNKAYPGVKIEKFKGKSDFRNVDAIQNTSKFLLSIIPEYKKRESLPKLEVAESIAPHMSLGNNTSESFNFFVSGVKKLVA